MSYSRYVAPVRAQEGDFGKFPLAATRRQILRSLALAGVSDAVPFEQPA